MRSKSVPVIFLPFLLLYSSLDAGTLREKFDQTFDFRRGGKLILTNTNGGIVVEAWDRNEVRIEAEKIVKSRDRRLAEEIMKEIRIEIDHNDDYLEIHTKIPKHKHGFWGSVFGDRVSISVKYRLTVPRELKLDVSTVNGAVDVSDVSGNIRVKSTNGHVHVYEAKGTVDAKTTNGGIDVELLDFDEDEDMSFKTTNGGIKVYFPRNFRAYVDAKTTNGSITTDFPIKVRGEISRKRLQGSINEGGGRIKLHTTNGSIKILER